ncbi:MAG: cellulose biosynthesis cyclic di-GMP-binding regulatory protein BcsB [Achromobacter sp.]|nr:cellulose biosynthesis cyclic di-GMP-binding regulatory protein BcsB [Achromobacter sp.]
MHRNTFRPIASHLRRALIAAGLALPLAAVASSAGDALRRLQSDDWITRDTSLADLGINEPVVLSNSDAHQDFYLPVPRGVPIADATLNFDARYTKDEPGRTNLVLWADGVPLAAQNIADGNGPVLRNLPLEQRLRSTGFLRLGVDWQSEIALRRCESNRATANALTISPQTRLSYRYDASAIGNLDDAWSTLPGKPVLLVSDTKLDQQAYDSAWRMGVAMQRAGKRVDVKAFPAVGDEIDTRALQVPAGLAQAPVFTAVAGKERHKLASTAEIGALLVLGAPAVTGDVVIASPALRAKLNAALDALQTELASDPDAADAFKSWRQARAPLASADMAAKEARLAPMGRLSVIAVAPDAGAQAAGVFNAAWRRIQWAGAGALGWMSMKSGMTAL